MGFLFVCFLFFIFCFCLFCFFSRFFHFLFCLMFLIVLMLTVTPLFKSVRTSLCTDEIIEKPVAVCYKHSSTQTAVF